MEVLRSGRGEGRGVLVGSDEIDGWVRWGGGEKAGSFERA